MEFMPEIPDQEIESQGDPHPYRSPDQRLPERKDVAFPVEESQVEGQHHEDEDQEAGKHQEFVMDHFNSDTKQDKNRN
jgi:hypothetical protein